jgi:uncharacterized cupredoxin-like copper-binding protein/mono/diheme cytochrome c family protein
MNTSKQVNIMIGLLFLSFVTFGGYIAWEPTRSSDAEEGQAELFAERASIIYVNNCRGCHGLEGEGHIGPPLATSAFLVLGDDNAFGLEATSDGEADGIRSFLHDTISCGRSGTFMPVWAQDQGGALSRIQIDYVVELVTAARWDLVEEFGLEHDLEQNALAPIRGILANLVAQGITAEQAVEELNELGATDLAQAADILGRLASGDIPLTIALEELEARDLEAAALTFGRGIFGLLAAGEITAEAAVEAWIELGETDRGIYLAHEAGLIEEEQLHEIFKAQVLVLGDNIAALSVTSSNCGQYTAAELTEVRDRDPLVASTPPPDDGTPGATATATDTPPTGGDAFAVAGTEFTITADASIDGGNLAVTFNNVGATPHELVIVRSDLAPDALPVSGATADEGELDVVGRIDTIAGGQSATRGFNLSAGSYLLICNIPGHYALGMTTALTVR